MTSIKELLESIIEASKPKTQAFDTTATVTRVENGIAWVHIPGGVRETPVNLTINAQAGDTVQVRVSGGRAFLVGNESAPPTDDRVATQAVQSIEKTNKVVAVVKEMAERVARIAGNTNQYFWHTESGTDTGAHITEIPQEEFLADPEHGGGNLLARSNGVAVRDGLKELAVFGTETAIYTKNGTELAHFGYASGNTEEGGTAVTPYTTLGCRATATAEYDSSKTYAKGDVVIYEGEAYVCCENITEAEAWTASHWLKANIGNWSIAEGYLIVASGAASHAEGNRSVSFGTGSHAEGYKTMASGSSSHAEGGTTVASGSGSHAEGVDTIASEAHSHAEGHGSKAQGNPSHAEGYKTLASGTGAHSEGYNTEASGYASHAEGTQTSSTGTASHAEGTQTSSTGTASHTEGAKTIAEGYASHTGGLGTRATRDYQTVIGYYNELTEVDGETDSGNYLFVVGNGKSDTERSNAFSIGPGGGIKVNGKYADFPRYLGLTANGTYTLPFERGAYLIVTGHNSTAALNGLWIVRLNNNSVWKLAGGGNVTITASDNKKITVTTTAGKVSVTCIYLGY